MDEKLFQQYASFSPGQQRNIDLDQLQKELQRAFDVVSKRINEVEAIALAQINLQKMILGIFLDLEMVEIDALVNALEHLQAERTDDIAKTMLAGMIESFKKSHGSATPAEPHLRLVSFCQPKPDQAD